MLEVRHAVPLARHSLFGQLPYQKLRIAKLTGRNIAETSAGVVAEYRKIVPFMCEEGIEHPFPSGLDGSLEGENRCRDCMVKAVKLISEGFIESNRKVRMLDFALDGLNVLSLLGGGFGTSSLMYFSKRRRRSLASFNGD